MNKSAALVRERRSRPVAADAAKVRLVLDNGTIYPLPGKLLFSEPRSMPSPVR